MKRQHAIVIAAALVALAGCGDSDTTPSAPASAPPVPVPDGSSAAPSIDAGTLDATSAYLSALGRLDRRLVSNAQAALDNGQLSCVDIEERRSTADQEKNVATRFAVDAGQAKKILAVTKANLCLS